MSGKGNELTRDQIKAMLLSAAGPRGKAIQWLIDNAKPGGVLFITATTAQDAGVDKKTLARVLVELRSHNLCVREMPGVYKLVPLCGPGRSNGSDN